MKRVGLFSMLFLLCAMCVIPTIVEGQPAALTTQLAKSKHGVSWVISSAWDTVNAQSAQQTMYFTLPGGSSQSLNSNAKDSLLTGGEWEGLLFLEIDTTAGNLTQHDMDFFIEESAAPTGGANFRTALNPAGSAAEVTTTPSLAAGVGSHLAFLIAGIRARLRVLVTDGVLRYRWYAVIKKKSDPHN